MAFLTRKKVGHKKYLQVVESYRKDGKPRQRVLRHVGPYASLEHALADLQSRANNLSWAFDISLSDRQRSMQLYAEEVAELRSFLASCNIAVDEAEVERLLEMLPGHRERENDAVVRLRS